MLTDRRLNDEEPDYEPPSRQTLYAAIRTKIGESLRKRYEIARGLPDRMRELLIQLDEKSGID